MWEPRPGLVLGKGAYGAALTHLQCLLSLLQKNYGPQIRSILTQHEIKRYKFWNSMEKVFLTTVSHCNFQALFDCVS